MRNGEFISASAIIPVNGGRIFSFKSEAYPNQEIFFLLLTQVSLPIPFLQLAEVKVRVLEAKQALEDCIAAQEFSRAAELKDSITSLEDHRNQILQEISESNQLTDKEVRVEKVGKRRQKPSPVSF